MSGYLNDASIPYSFSCGYERVVSDPEQYIPIYACAPFSLDSESNISSLAQAYPLLCETRKLQESFKSRAEYVVYNVITNSFYSWFFYDGRDISKVERTLEELTQNYDRIVKANVNAALTNLVTEIPYDIKAPQGSAATDYPWTYRLNPIEALNTSVEHGGLHLSIAKNRSLSSQYITRLGLGGYLVDCRPSVMENDDLYYQSTTASYFTPTIADDKKWLMINLHYCLVVKAKFRNIIVTALLMGEFHKLTFTKDDIQLWIDPDISFKNTNDSEFFHKNIYIPARNEQKISIKVVKDLTSTLFDYNNAAAANPMELSTNIGYAINNARNYLVHPEQYEVNANHIF